MCLVMFAFHHTNYIQCQILFYPWGPSACTIKKTLFYGNSFNDRTLIQAYDYLQFYHDYILCNILHIIWFKDTK